MKLSILTIFCFVSITASAQFWQKKEKVTPSFPRYELLPEAVGDFAVNITPVKMPGVSKATYSRSLNDIKLAEELILKEAKHNMRFRIYNVASYDFSELAELYILQHRYSEAKWYLLQSNTISREENNDKHTISNLIGLAAIKVAIGEKTLAKTDLQEAHDIAAAKNFTEDVASIDKLLHELQLNKSTIKAELRYAEAVELAAKSQ